MWSSSNRNNKYNLSNKIKSMGKSKDKLYLMTYLECQWEDSRNYVRTYERIEEEDYIKMVLRVKCKHSGEALYKIIGNQ